MDLSTFVFIKYEKLVFKMVIFLDSSARKFEYFILLTIAANCVVLMLEEPLPKRDTTDRNKKLVWIILFLL